MVRKPRASKRFPASRLRRRGLNEIEERAFRYKITEPQALSKYISILETLPGKNSRKRLLRLAKDPRLNMHERNRVARILMEKKPGLPLSLYLELKNLAQRVSTGKKQRQKIMLDMAEQWLFQARKWRPQAVKAYLDILEENPGRAAQQKLIKIIKNPQDYPRLTIGPRLRACEILEKQGIHKALSLYMKLLPVYDIPVPIRAHMVKALGRIPTAVYSRAIKRTLADKAQGYIVRGVCIEALEKSPSPPLKLFKEIARETRNPVLKAKLTGIISGHK